MDLCRHWLWKHYTHTLSLFLTLSRKFATDKNPTCSKSSFKGKHSFTTWIMNIIYAYTFKFLYSVKLGQRYMGILCTLLQLFCQLSAISACTVSWVNKRARELRLSGFSFISITREQEREGQSKGGKSFQRGRTNMLDARSQSPPTRRQESVPTE